MPHIIAGERPCELWDCCGEPWMNLIYADLWAVGLEPPWHLPGELFFFLTSFSAHLSFICLSCCQFLPLVPLQPFFLRNTKGTTVCISSGVPPSNMPHAKLLKWHFGSSWCTVRGEMTAMGVALDMGMQDVDSIMIVSQIHGTFQIVVHQDMLWQAGIQQDYTAKCDTTHNSFWDKTGVAWTWWPRLTAFAVSLRGIILKGVSIILSTPF